MIITVFGATGQVGKRIINMCLAQGYAVKAFGRNIDSLIDVDLRSENFTAIRGHVFDAGDVFNAVKNCDAVLSALGGAIGGEDKTRSLGIKNIIAQMNKASIKRICAVGEIGVLKDDDVEYILNRPQYPGLLKTVALEHLKAYEYLVASGLDWTFVCCPEIKDEDANGKYITREDYPPEPNLFAVSAGNVADFMIRELSSNRYIKKRVGISDAN